MIHQRHEPRGVHTDEPVCLCTAQCSGVEVVVLRARTHICISFAYLVGLHRAEPQALDGLSAARFLVDQPEYELALAPGVTCVDDLANVCLLHQAAKNLKLLPLVPHDGCFPLFRQDGQILAPPLAELFVVGCGHRQLDKVAIAPRDNEVAAVYAAVPADVRVQRRGYGAGYRGLLGYYECFCVQ